MQTYTHLALGAAVGATLFPHQPVVQLACLAGAVIPDAPMIMLFGLDKIAGRPPMVQQPKFWILMKNLCQDLILWLLVGLVGVWLFFHYDGMLSLDLGFGDSLIDQVPMALIALGINGVIHVVVDRYTHGDPEFQKNDGSYLWPFATWRRVGWDYRISIGQLWPPKPAEWNLIVACLVFIALGWILRF